MTQNRNSSTSDVATHSTHKLTVSNPQQDVATHRNRCLDSLLNFGLILDNVNLDGRFHNAAVQDHSSKKRPGWYVGQKITLSNKTIVFATYGDFREGINHTFSSYSENTDQLTSEDREKFQQAKAANLKRVEAEKASTQAKAAKVAQAEFNKLSDTGTSDYLARKQVEAHDVRYGHGFIAVPAYGSGGLRGIQKIFNNGDKRFTTGAEIKGSFHILGEIADAEIIHFSEGYSTAATIYEATNKPAVCCFNAGNLDPVIAEFREKYPDNTFIICADNDQFSEINTGLVKATASATKHNCSVVFPEFTDLSTKPTDFNDLLILGGDVAGQVNGARPQAAWEFDNKLTLLENIQHIPLPAPGNAINSIIARSVQEHPLIPYKSTIDALEKRMGKLSKNHNNWLNELLRKQSDNTRKLHTMVRYNLPEFDINQPNAAEILSTSEAIYIDSRPMGSGKTLFTAQLLKYLKTHNKTFGYTAHRQSIIAATAERLGVEHYHDIVAGDLIQDLAACINSALQRKHLLNFFGQCDCIVLDEFKQIIEHITQGTFSNRSEGLYLLVEIIKSVPVAYIADADMNDRTLDVLKTIGRPMFHIKGDERKPTAKIKHTTRKIAKSELIRNVEKGNRGIFQCDGVPTAETAFKDAKNSAPAGYKILLVHRKNKDEPEQSAYLKSPNEVGKQYDLIILTPVVSSGFSIELDYDFHIGIFSGVLSPTEIIQTLGRSRRSKQIILGLDVKRKQKPLTTAEQLTGIATAEGRFKWVGGSLVHKPNAFDLVAAAAIEEREKSCQLFAQTTLLILMQKGYPVEELAEPDKIINIKGTSKLVKMEHTLRVLSSDDINADERKRLQLADKVLESEHFAIEKHDCKNQLALEGEPLEGDVFLWDRGKIAPALKRFEIVTAQADDVDRLDKYEAKTMKPAKDKAYAKSQNIIFSTVMKILQGKTLEATESLKTQADEQCITKETPHVPAFPVNTGLSLKRYDSDKITAAIDYLRNHYAEAHAAGLGNFKSIGRQYDARTLGYFLKRFGLNHEAVGDKNNRKYQITEESLLMMQGITHRRQMNHISAFNQSNEWQKNAEQKVA